MTDVATMTEESAPETLQLPTNCLEELGKHVDLEEFKRMTIRQVMQSTVGKNPMDYYLAELAVDVWMKNYTKTAEELEAYIREADPMALGEEIEAGFSVVGDKLEPTIEDEPVEPVPCCA